MINNTSAASPATAKIASTRFLYSDILRFVAVAAVVLLHVSAFIIYEYNHYPRGWWWLANLVDSGTRWCVPIFLMLSGRLLLDPQKSEPIAVFLKKRFLRVLIPLVIWSIFYALYSAGFDLSKISVLDLLRKIVQGPVYFHLGFLYVLISLYLITPILRLYVAKAPISNFAYFLILWFGFTAILPQLERFTTFRIALSPQLVLGYVGYFLLGYVLGTIDLSRWMRAVLYVLGLLALTATMFGTYSLTVNNSGNLDEFFYGYLTPNVIVMAAAVFVFFKTIDWERILQKTAALQKMLIYLGGISFGIYLVHPVILEILSRNKINAAFIHPLIGIPLTAVLTLLISGLIIALLKLIPWVKNMVG